LESNSRSWKVVIAVLGVGLIPVGSTVVQAQTPGDRPLSRLTGVPPAPSVDAWNAIVKDPATLVALGKALFWDTQVGKANEQACASCHFHAGVDSRTVNQLSPGLKREPTPDSSFGGVANPPNGFSNPGPNSGNLAMKGGAAAGPNIPLVSNDFPFHQLTDVNDRQSAVLFDSNDVTSSQGAFQGGPVTLDGNVVGSNIRCASSPGAPFAINAGGTSLNTRKVEPRNTPTMINAAFNHRNFWDGRANNIFNGVSPFGRRDTKARVFQLDASGSSIVPQQLRLENMSAASQAVGPLLSSFEMTCEGKTFPEVGRRLMLLRALQTQTVAADDGVFSKLLAGSTAPRFGLSQNYRQLVRQAFQPAYWNNTLYFAYNPDSGTVSSSPSSANGFQLDELNFSLFFGLAIDAYERTLISDQTPFDAGLPSGSPAQLGQSLFVGKASCIACHDGPLLSKAAFTKDESFQRIEHMPMNQGDPAFPEVPSFYDHGFYNTGVRPAFEDTGVGGTDPFGNELSFTRQLLQSPPPNDTTNIGIDQFQIDPCQFEIVFDNTNCHLLPNASQAPRQRVDVDAAFKTSGLRNIALTAPYMHNGGMKSLTEVLEFYNRGGDRRSVSNSGASENDTTGTGPLGQSKPIGPNMGGSNVHRDVKSLGLSPDERTQIVEFMKSLTDPRVACHKAPFDHPSLTVANGQRPQDVNNDRNADDVDLRIPAVGAGGYSTCGANFNALNSGDLFTSSSAFKNLK